MDIWNIACLKLRMAYLGSMLRFEVLSVWVPVLPEGGDGE